MNEMPSISASTYSSSAMRGALIGIADAQPPIREAMQNALLGSVNQNKEIKPMSTARIVKVFIADPNDNLPLDKRVIYSGEEKLTDSTDQELFFEVPIGDLLAKQNAVRAATLDKKASDKTGREIYLEPARIRDLKMVVVTIAQF